MLKNRLVFLRLNKLEHIPSALNSINLLCENGFPVAAIEFGESYKETSRMQVPWLRLRLGSAYLSWVPSKLRSSFLFVSTFFRLICLVVRHGRPAFVVAHGLMEQTMSLALKAIFGIPYSVHVHEIYEPTELTPLNRFLLRIEGLALRKSDFLIFSERTREAIYRERYSLNVPSAFAANCPRRRDVPVKKRPLYGLSPSAVVMTYVGGIGSSNPVDLAVQALSRLPKEWPFYFLLMGWSDAEKQSALESSVSELGLSGRVRFLGEVADKWQVLDSSDIGFCVYHPNRLRLKHLASASNKLMEYMASGLAVLAGHGEDFKQIIELERIGVCVSSDNIDEMETALRQLYTRAQERRQMGSRAYELHATRYHYEKQFQSVIALFHRYFPAPCEQNSPQSSSENAISY